MPIPNGGRPKFFHCRINNQHLERNGFVDLYITSDLIEAVEDKIALIDSGKLSGAEAVEAIHLTAEPQKEKHA